MCLVLTERRRRTQYDAYVGYSRADNRGHVDLYGAAMLAVIYRWRVKEGMEDQFRDGWVKVTRAIHASCGSYGSRLHRAADGSWVAYARWPDSATRNACEHSETEGFRLMHEAIEDTFDEQVLTVTDDLLSEPRSDP